MFELGAGKPYVRLCCFGWGEVGWGNNVQLHLHTMVMLRYEIVSSVWGDVGGGGVIMFNLMLRCKIFLTVCSNT